jgi:hypothetical protein
LHIVYWEQRVRFHKQRQTTRMCYAGTTTTATATAATAAASAAAAAAAAATAAIAATATAARRHRYVRQSVPSSQLTNRQLEY